MKKVLPKIAIIDGHYKQDFYGHLLEQIEADWSFVTSQSAANEIKEPVDLVILNDQVWEFNACALAELKHRTIPTLQLLDGILEWRHTWEIPRALNEDEGMPFLQPALADKIACLGRSQARVLESWGNLGKCEIVGSPRFDNLLSNQPVQPKADNSIWRVLISTASTIGFTEPQISKTIKSLLELKEWFDANPFIGETKIEPVWRLTQGADAKIGVKNETNTLSADSLREQLQTVNSVITTPSTIMLECMLFNLPVALLNYHNCPQYVPAAWTIGAQQHISEVVNGLFKPPPNRMLYQDMVLHDSLECQTPATPRITELIAWMVEIGRQARRDKKELIFPTRILPDSSYLPHLPEERFDLQLLYPNHPVFSRMNLIELQTEVANLRKIVKTRPSQIIYRGLAKLQKLIGL